MDSLQIKGALSRYLKIPLFMLIVFIVIDISLFLYDRRLGFYGLAFFVIYALFVYVFYYLLKKKLPTELITFAMQYGTVQKRLLDSLQLEYAIFDKKGNILWANQQFKELSKKDNVVLEYISNIFKEITLDVIEKNEEEEISIKVSYDDKIFNALIKKMTFNDLDTVDNMIRIRSEVDTPQLYSLMLFDETELNIVKQENDNQKLVAGIVYIDNFDDTLDTVEDVKKALLIAIVERKIQKYFKETDAIIRKLEKDRFFVIFKKKYLSMLLKDEFSILEDIKTIKAGNEREITLSIGIGLGGESYYQNMEYSRLALGMALGRGGSQAVVKNCSEVSYFGIHGKEVAPNTRVKARVKAQALNELMNSRNEVIVMGHAMTDFDALGASIGIYCAARELGKPCHIVINSVTKSMRPIIETFLDDESYPDDLFVNSEEALNIVTDKSLVVVVDTNRPSHTECPKLLDRRQIVVFDHHRQGKEQIINPLISYIETYASSTCEIIAEILQHFSESVKLNPKEADCLYAGMLIDTNNFMAKTGVRTFEAAAFLRRNGAEVTRVRKLLREDMDAYKARAEIVRHAQVYKGAFAFSKCEARDIESPTVVGAQASNELLNIVGIKASFVLTDYMNKIYVSSRSIDEIDVQLIMERLGGGGHLNIAGAQIEGASIEGVMDNIKSIIDDMINKGEIKI